MAQGVQTFQSPFSLFVFFQNEQEDALVLCTHLVVTFNMLNQDLRWPFADFLFLLTLDALSICL